MQPYEVASGLHEENYFAFLDSSRIDAEQGRYSILARRPKTVLRLKDENPFPAIDDLLRTGARGGVIGYFSYDLFRFLEHYKTLHAVDDLGLPGCCLMAYDDVLVYDHQTERWSGDVPKRSSMSKGFKAGNAESNMTKQKYVAAVERALEYIAAGDIYQVNLSQRFSHPFEGSSFALFGALRQVSPSFYGAYLNCGDHAIISSSPELFLKKTGGIIETRPIKGTRPRGRSAEEDRAMRQELLNSAKEAAELTMVVDLERNDLGRICEYGSVDVVSHRYIDELPTLLHTVSTVRGRLRPGISTVDVLRATFPGGSISGCPKIRAIEVIDELEPTRRHVYTGSIGYFAPDGDFTLNIAIRTMIVAGNRLHYQVGGGIVADSDPEREYQETLDKAAAMRRAIEGAG
ncbi:MAG TPA: aminodeoxychorismate synthase component I [Terriglobia bacterium]|nr:aminodeoxychorismate synthase component I [Terriglobia bacterium]